MLASLRPHTSVNLKELTRHGETGPLHLLYPSALNESVLLGLARDLRQLESQPDDRDASEASLAPSLYLVCEFLMRPGTTYHSSGQFEMSEAAMARAIRVLQAAIEREIVTRIVGIESLMTDDDFLAELDLSLRKSKLEDDDH
ncbi:MAG: hypothetical protein V4542_02185 [Pseudomonadota bacterium]